MDDEARRAGVAVAEGRLAFGAQAVLRGADLVVPEGSIVALLGPSGCGKTTLLRSIAGLERVDAGVITVAGAVVDDAGAVFVAPERRGVGMVFQDWALFPHLTVAENVGYGVRDRARRAAAVEENLARVGLAGLGDRLPGTLSGGQKQRVALARGLVNKPRLLLLDEPLGALDAKLRERMQGELIALQREVGVTFVFVTHAQQEALALSHRIAVMNAGRVEQTDVPEVLYSAPKNRFVADFIGTINLIDAAVVDAGPHGLRLAAAGLGEIAAPAHPEAAAGSRGALAIRPEHLRVTPDGGQASLKNHFVGTVREYLYLGDVTVYKVGLDNGVTLEALTTNAAPGKARFHEIGDRVCVEWRHDAGVFLPA